MSEFSKVYLPPGFGRAAALLHNEDYVPLKGTILAFHGGCFTGGSTSWDADQNRALAKLGFVVVQVSFPQNVMAFREWAKKFHKTLAEPVYCLGRSSGGHLAKEFVQWSPQIIHKTIYICPVFQPFVRSQIVPQMAKKTLQFFGPENPIDTKTFDPTKELLLLAHRDANVPLQCFTPQQRAFAKYLGPVTHTGMCQTTSRKFLDEVTTFFSES